MEIHLENSAYHRFALYYKYDKKIVEFCRVIQGSFGWQNFCFRAEGDKKRWVFSSVDIALAFQAKFPDCVIDPGVLNVIDHETGALKAAKQNEILISEIKKKEDTNFDVSGLKMNLYPYQKVGVEFLVASGGRAIVAEEMGLGKSFETIAYIKHQGIRRSLVVSPASVKFVWKKELEKFLPGAASFIINGKPTPDLVDRLESFLFFNEKEWFKSHKEDKHVHAPCKDPASLCFHCLKGRFRFFESSDISFPSEFTKEVDKANVSVVNTENPAGGLVPAFLSGDVTRDGAFPVDDSSDIGESNRIGGNRDTDGFSFRPSVLPKDNLKFPGRSPDSDPEVVGNLLVGSSGAVKSLCSFCHLRAPVDFSFFRHKVIIINYDILSKWIAVMQKQRFEIIIADEGQYVKSPNAQRTKAVRILSRDIPKVLLLSGTPLLSRPAELYSLLNIVDPGTWNNIYDFYRRYCDAKHTRFGWDVSGSSNEAELHSRIKKYFIRRKKSEVLKDLPPKIYVDIPVKLSPDVEKDYSAASGNFAMYLRQHSGKQPADIAKTLQAEKLARLNELRQLNARGKIDTAIEMVENIIEGGEKVIVFSSFNEPIQKLNQHFGNKSVVVTGQTPMDERQQAVEAFQQNKNVQVFLGGIKSAGVGLTLTAASTVLFIDFSWNPADMQQAQDRACRIGQKAKNVTIYQLFAMDTIDEDMKDTLDLKQYVFDQIIEGTAGEKTAKKAMDQALSRVLQDKQDETPWRGF